MILTRRLLLRVFFGIEVVIFSGFYFFGGQGIRGIRALHKHTALSILENKALEDEIKNLEDTVLAWQTNPFYKEKVAREQLQMARKGDIIYLTI